MIRPLTPAHLPAARALAEAQRARAGFGARALELLPLAAAGTTPEHRGAVLEAEGALAGVILYGEVAGAVGTGAIHALLLPSAAAERAAEHAQRLAAHALAAAREGGARLVVAELPDVAPLALARGALEASGFVEEARVPDYFRDGVALLLLRREL